MRNLLDRNSLAALCFAGLSFLAPAAEAGSGAQLAFGQINQPIALKDTVSGRTYNLFIEAREGSTAGVGDTTILVTDSPSRICSVHGPAPGALQGTAFNYYSGQSDYAFECGTAYGETVKINSCTATVQAHGYVHQDAPLSNYLGTTTIDFSASKTNGVYNLTLKIVAPRGELKVSGPLPSGAYRNWPSCP